MFKITNEDIDKFFSDNSSLNQTNQYSLSVNEMKLLILDNQDYSFIRKKLWSLDHRRIEEILKNCQNSPSISFLIKSLFFVDPLPNSNLYYNENFLKTIFDLEPKDDGNLSGSLFRHKNAFLMKLLENQTQLHECVIAEKGLNYVRKYVPNFLYFYAPISSTIPFSSENLVLSWFPQTKNPSQGRNFLLWEDYSSVSVRELIETAKMTKEMFINFYFQILYALRIANLECSFGHYDLNVDSVEIQTLTRPISVEYRLENGNNGYQNFQLLAKIKNFSKSYISFNDGCSCQKIGFSGFSTSNKRSWLIQDAYMFLMSTMKLAYDYNLEEILTEGRKIFKFFNDKEDLEDCLKFQERFDYHLPLVKELDGSFDYFLDFLRKLYPQEISQSPRFSVYQGNFNPENALFLTKTIADPKTILSFYDTLLMEKNRGKIEENFIKHRLESLRVYYDELNNFFQIGQKLFEDIELSETISNASLISLGENYSQLVFRLYLLFEVSKIIDYSNFPDVVKEMIDFVYSCREKIQDSIDTFKTGVIFRYLSFLILESDLFLNQENFSLVSRVSL